MSRKGETASVVVGFFLSMFVFLFVQSVSCALRKRKRILWRMKTSHARKKKTFSLRQKEERGKRKKKTHMGKKKLSGAAKRKKKKEKEKAIAEAEADLERLKLGPTKLWTGLVLHHRDIFASHVLPKLNKTDRWFFASANTESWDVLEYAGIDVPKLRWSICDYTSISTLEMAWNNIKWGKKCDDGNVLDQAWFCSQVAGTNKLELLKWVREEKKCEWDERTINAAAFVGNLEMLKYCFGNGCPYDEQKLCCQAAGKGHLDCLRFLFAKVKPSRKTEKATVQEAAEHGRLDILKYFVEERKISDGVKAEGMLGSAVGGQLDCLKYLVEEAKAPHKHPLFITSARYHEHTDCVHYLREKGCPVPTDAQYARFITAEARNSKAANE